MATAIDAAEDEKGDGNGIISGNEGGSDSGGVPESVRIDSRGNLYQLDAYDDDEDNDGDVQPLPSPSSPLYDAFALGALSSSTRAGGDSDSDADVGNGNGEGDAPLPSQPPPPPPPSLQALQALQHVDSDLDEASFDEQQQQQQQLSE
jgi:hypothetical protein